MAYAYALIERDPYATMPCTTDEAGKVDWTIPSNRKPGSKNWDGNARRRSWWEMQARSLGIPLSEKWISRAAKLLHPWGWKPCQTCGRWMRLSYAYPRAPTVARLNSHLEPEDQLAWSDFLDLYEIAEHVENVLGLPGARAALGEVFPEAATVLQRAATLADMWDALERLVVRPESRMLSPGAMSNAPDRLDGFHTYNLCCRSKEDRGRSLDNLKTYGVDRRAFEHWSEGDWEAANLLMSRTAVARCTRCGERRRLTADHVGPISLGFRHTAHFDAVCAPCNSAKNNRMSKRDIDRLLELESMGEPVVSWQALPLWDRAKGRVRDDAGALRLSKLMNVNQHEFLRLLVKVRAQGASDALVQFLSPAYAEQKVTFEGLDRETLEYDKIVRRPRQRTYALQKAARLVRIAFEALDEYAQKQNRNVSIVPPELLTGERADVERAIGEAVASPSEWREALNLALDPAVSASVRENRISEILGPGSYLPDRDFSDLRKALGKYMNRVGELLAERLDDNHAIKEWTALVSE